VIDDDGRRSGFFAQDCQGYDARSPAQVHDPFNVAQIQRRSHSVGQREMQFVKHVGEATGEPGILGD